MGRDSNLLNDSNLHIPPSPDILAVAAAASDERDPVAVIQEAVDAHHNEMVGIIQTLLDRQAEIANSSATESNTSKAEDRLLALRELDVLTTKAGLKDVRLMEPNEKKGNYRGGIAVLTEHHLIQKVGEKSFIVHDRHKIETGQELNIKDRLQIKYNAGRVHVNTASHAAAVNTAATQELADNEQQALKNMMDSKSLSSESGVINSNQDREAE
jgi:hypothetical protein